MCDTFIALGNATADGSVIFGKNSDREPNEAHQLLLIPAADHAPGSQVKCTYRTVEQISHTHAVLLAKPFWIWGAEMGANEHGVVIGNEAVFTRMPYDKGDGLIGMDFIRLALERSTSADEALDVMIRLLEEYGQGGNCGFTHGFYYHNSFILADRASAWVFETAGREWAAQRVVDVRSISNALTIGREWDRASKGLVQTAIQKGWCKSEADFDFARCYSDPLYTRLADAGSRRVCTTAAMEAAKGKITPAMAMNFLRQHAHSHEKLNADLTGADVCMHAAAGPVRNSQSVGSMVAQLKEGASTYWLTGTSAPCTSVFKPVWMDSGLPEQEMGPAPTGTYDHQTLFWRHELLHREVLRDFSARLAIFSTERDALEAQFIEQATRLKDADPDQRYQLSAACFARATECEADWLTRVQTRLPQRNPAFYYRLAWKAFSRQANMPERG